MAQGTVTGIIFEVAEVTHHAVTLEALDTRDGLILMGLQNEPASVSLPSSGTLADARPGDRFRLSPEPGPARGR